MVDVDGQLAISLLDCGLTVGTPVPGGPYQKIGFEVVWLPATGEFCVYVYRQQYGAPGVGYLPGFVQFGCRRGIIWGVTRDPCAYEGPFREYDAGPGVIAVGNGTGSVSIGAPTAGGGLAETEYELFSCDQTPWGIDPIRDVIGEFGDWIEGLPGAIEEEYLRRYYGGWLPYRP